jgi:hypothetical protein
MKARGKTGIHLFTYLFIHLFILILYFYYCCTRGTLGHLQNFLLHTIIEFTTSIVLLYPPLPNPGIVSTGLIFPLTYMCTEYSYHIHPLTPSLLISLLPLVLTSKTGPVLLSCSQNGHSLMCIHVQLPCLWLMCSAT